MDKSSGDYDIFVSYANEDMGYVNKLVDALRRRDMKVWFDGGELRIGDTMLRQIEDALEGSQFFALMISKDYLNDAWTFFEMGVAISRENETGGERIIPIVLDEVNLSEVHSLVREKRRLNANQQSVDQIASELAKVVKRSKEKV